MGLLNFRKLLKVSSRKGYKKGYREAKEEAAIEIKQIKKVATEQLARANQKIRLRDKKVLKIENSTEKIKNIMPTLKYVLSEAESDVRLSENILGDNVKKKKKITEKLGFAIDCFENNYPKTTDIINDYNNHIINNTVKNENSE